MAKTFDPRDFARRRWPQAEIDGDGPWCVLVSCYENKGVHLYKTRLEAVTDLAKFNDVGCGDVRCQRVGHRLVLLEPVPFSPWRNPADRERDSHDEDDE